MPAGDCATIPTCTWVGRVFESGYTYWMAHSDLTMPQCRGIDPFPTTNCDCYEPDRPAAYDYEVVYTPCNALT
jgi:hypothetical protein